MSGDLTLEATRVPDLGYTGYDVSPAPDTPNVPESTISDFGHAILKDLRTTRIGEGAVQIGYNLLFDDSKQINPFEKWKESGLSDKYFDQAMNVKTENEWDQFMADTASDEEIDRVISDFGLTGTAARFVTSVASDLTTYATFGAGMMLKPLGAAKAFAASGALAGAAYSAENYIDNPYKNAGSDLAVNVASGAIIGGLLGKATDTFFTLKSKSIIKKDFHEMSREALTQEPPQALSLSAAVAEKNDYRTGGNVVSRILNKAISFASPRARGQSARSAATSEIYAKMFGTSAKTKGNMESQIASGASFGEETEKLRQQSVGRMRDFGDKLSALERSGHIVDEKKFDEAARLAWSGVENVDLDRVDPVVKEILNFHGEYKKYRALMEAEGVPKFTAREDYGAPVIVSPAKAAEKIEELKVRNFNTLKAKQAVAETEIAKLKAERNELLSKYARQNVAKPLAYIEERLTALENLAYATDDDIMNDAILSASNMASGRSNEIHMLPADEAKKLKPKFFDYRSIDPLDYIDVLETNPFVMMSRYTDEVSPHIAFNRIFKGKSITDVTREYAEAMKAEIKDAVLSGDKKLADKLSKESEIALADIANGFDTETGMYSARAVSQVGSLAPYLNATSNVVNMAMLGGQVMGSLSEVSAVALHHGLGNAGLKVTKALASFAADPSLVSATRKEAGYFGVGLELAKNKLLNDMIGHELLAAEVGGKAGKILHKSNVMFQRLNLSVYYDSLNRSLSFIVQQGMMKERMAKFSKLTKDELSDLAYLGIDKTNVKAISAQLKKYGTDEKGVFFSNPEKWDDHTAREIWVNALRKDNRRTSVQPDLGEVPFFFRTPIGKNMFKFKSWSIAATQKYLIQVSQSPVRSLPAVGFMVLTSGAIDVLYNKSQGKDVSTDPDELLWAAINRSGMLGVIPEAGGSFLLNRVAGIQSGGARVYNYNDIQSIAAGPVGSFANDLLKTAPIPKRQDDGSYKSPYTDKKGNIKESSVNHLLNVLPIPLVKPYLKAYGTPALINSDE